LSIRPTVWLVLSVPIEVTAVVHEIEGGGYWAEVSCFPGCVAQAESLEVLRVNLLLAIREWHSLSENTRWDERKVSPEPITIPARSARCHPLGSSAV
jgi:predicted RNase H-like HicB family nuclease